LDIFCGCQLQNNGECVEIPVPPPKSIKGQPERVINAHGLALGYHISTICVALLTHIQYFFPGFYNKHSVYGIAWVNEFGSPVIQSFSLQQFAEDDQHHQRPDLPTLVLKKFLSV